VGAAGWRRGGRRGADAGGGGRRGRPAGTVSLALIATAAAGCSTPSWMPLIGKSKPAPRAQAAAAPAVTPPAAPPAPGRLGASGQRLPDSQSVMDRVICVVNNDAITLYELDEAEAHYLYETKQEGMADDARPQL